jgi:DNA-binding CsgD family transcriptional regulator
VLPHMDVLTTVLVLLVGVWAIFTFRQKARRFADTGLRYFLWFMAFFNLFELERFILAYFFSNLPPGRAPGFLALLDAIDWPLRSLLILGMFAAQFHLVAWLGEKKLPRWFIPALVLFVAAMPAAFLLTGWFRGGGAAPLAYWDALVWPLNLLLLHQLVGLLRLSRHRHDPGQRRANRGFAWFFLAHLLGQALFLPLADVAPGYGIILAAKLLLLYTNLMPIWWLIRYYAPWAGTLSRLTLSPGHLDALRRSHGLSPRELEIMILVLDGKSYREIEERLFISIHTVKSHVYNLYRKIGVGSRHQLTHWLATRQQDDS